MREILFRGKGDKKYNDGMWYFGVPICCYDGDWQICTDNSKRTVIPETIGQYTGLTDKNGKRIFEGDIIKYKNTDGIKFNGVALTTIGKVVYNEKNASFAISGKDEIGAKYYDYFPIKNIEVIGNIHDDPELLRGDTNV